MKRFRLLLLYLGVAVIFISFLMMLFSAVYYEGGTPVSSSLDHYSLTENLLTDLGRTKGYNGISNSPSQDLFRASVKSLLFALPIIHLIWVFTFQRHRSRLWAAASIIFMVLASFHLWGVAAFPQDENYPRHFLFLTRSLAAFSLSYLTAYFAYYFEPKYAFAFPAPILFIGLIIGIRWMLLIWGPDPWQSDTILFWYLGLQKVVWLGIYLISFYHIHQILRRLREEN